MSYSFHKIADNWSAMTDTEKHNALEGTEYMKPTISELQAMGKFKVVSEDKISTKVCGVPKTQLILPIKMIKTSSFERLNTVTITGTTDGGGDVRVAVTTNLSDYYVWDSVTLDWAPISISDIDTDGMTISEINTLTGNEWDKIVSFNLGDGVAFAYSLDITNASDKAEIDTLTFNVDMRGTWNKAVHGTDYIYGYPTNDSLKVQLLTDGEYKINYVE